jgi:hypothetical protein
VWVLIRDADVNWKKPKEENPREERPFDQEAFDARLDWVLHVFDPRVGRILAERRFPNSLAVAAGARVLVSLRNVETNRSTFDVWRPLLRQKGDP